MPFGTIEAERVKREHRTFFHAVSLKDEVTDLICLAQDNLSSMVTPRQTDEEYVVIDYFVIPPN